MKILILNKLFASIAFIIGIILSSRLFINREKVKNKLTIKGHKKLGIILIVTGVMHGILSEAPIISLKMGTMTLITSILLGMSFIFRIKLANWLKYHKGLTVLFLVFMILHIIEVIIF